MRRLTPSAPARPTVEVRGPDGPVTVPAPHGWTAGTVSLADAAAAADDIVAALGWPPSYRSRVLTAVAAWDDPSPGVPRLSRESLAARLATD
ncbi:hypothetical protein ATJ88_2874 [Isoptericola jiangsuensis]|uniref:Uncharacterized protein n=1 Tax=Isoptericola jiangsuensis TaxID=548579 RepID=A0A2A9F041_9MICO|nr:hypothetical protein [Isoptericola jiangsuensis]PFG44156.1 hypothetical protein ATJ88_2874 [Isoptericola jiangsuensis]